MKSRYRKELAADILARISPANHAVAELYFVAKQAQGVSVATLIGCMSALEKLDKLGGATPYQELDPERLTRILSTLATDKSEFTIRTVTKHWCAFFAWRHDGECPRPIKRALRRNSPRATRMIQPITGEEFQKLLGGFGTRFGQRVAGPVRSQACPLVDTLGFRFPYQRTPGIAGWQCSDRERWNGRAARYPGGCA